MKRKSGSKRSRMMERRKKKGVKRTEERGREKIMGK